MIVRFVFLGLFAPLCISDIAFAATLHVPADYPTIQSCIDAAVSGQDECVVAPGTYNELINFLGKAITLRSSHGPDVTTIDGTGLIGSVVKMVSNESQQTVFDGFTVTKGGSQFNKIFRGGGMYIFQSSPIIRNSIFRLNQAYAGGGIYIYTGKPVIQYCQFYDNTAYQTGGGIANRFHSETAILESTFGGNVAEDYYGGGIGNFDSTVDVINCDFYENTAEGGGGIANGSNEVDYFTVTGGRFWSNEANGQDPWQGGGAIYDDGRATVITGVAFDQNNAARGGALFNLTDELILRQCSFVSNSASYHGGALHGAGEVERCSFEANSAAVGNGGAIAAVPKYAWKITNSTFIDNSAASGGAIFGAREIRQCLFLYNQATVAGGAVHSPTTLSHSYLAANRATLEGGALYTDQPTRVFNTVFVGNEGNTGGAIYNEYRVSLFNCTLVKNLARDSGGAVANVDGVMSVHPLDVTSSLIHGNMASVNGPQLWSGKKPFDTDVYFSNIEGSGGSANWNSSLGNDGGGNLDADPEFIRFPHDGFDGWGDDPSTPNLDEGANDDFGDLRLAPGSPCINAGDPNFVPQPGETDLDSHARVLCGRVDMGAYEFGIGDYDCDQAVTLVDFAAWEECQTDPSAAPSPRPSPLEREGEVIEGHAFRGLAPPATHHRPFGAGSQPRTLPPWARPLPRGEGAVGCEAFDFDADGDVDLRDLARFMLIITP